MKVAFYGRISPRPDLESSPSPEQQYGMCLHFLEDQGVPTIPERFEDIGKSRDDMDRPALWAALRHCKGGILIALSLDRIGDVVAVETVMRMTKRTKTQVVTVAEGVQKSDADSELMRIIQGGVTRHQKRKISEITRLHMAEKRRQGHRISRFAPFGYRYEKIGTIKTKRGYLKDDYRMVPEPREQKLAEIIKRAYRKGMSVYAIVKQFRRRGVKVRDGYLNARRVYAILAGCVPVGGKRETVPLRPSNRRLARNRITPLPCSIPQAEIATTQ